MKNEVIVLLNEVTVDNEDLTILQNKTMDEQTGNISQTG